MIDLTTASVFRISSFILDREEPAADEVAWAEKEKEVVRTPERPFPGLGGDQRLALEEACGESLELLGYA